MCGTIPDRHRGSRIVGLLRSFALPYRLCVLTERRRSGHCSRLAAASPDGIEAKSARLDQLGKRAFERLFADGRSSTQIGAGARWRG